MLILQWVAVEWVIWDINKDATGIYSLENRSPLYYYSGGFFMALNKLFEIEIVMGKNEVQKKQFILFQRLQDCHKIFPKNLLPGLYLKEGV